MSAERDGCRTSCTLTEARTVLSRAETALKYLDTYCAGEDDPARAEIERALEQTVATLAPFRRTGRPR